MDPNSSSLISPIDEKVSDAREKLYKWINNTKNPQETENVLRIIIKCRKENLQILELFNYYNVSIIPEGFGIHKSVLTKINIGGCGIRKLFLLPETLLNLEIRSCNDLTTLPDVLPSNLISLEIAICDDIIKFPSVYPDTLESLKFLECAELISLPEMPLGLQKLNIVWCRKFKTVPNIPEGLLELNITGCRSITKIPNLPHTIQKLYLTDCSNLLYPPSFIPENIESFAFIGCCSLLTLSDSFPESLLKLNLSRCMKLVLDYDALPDNLLFSFDNCYHTTVTKEELLTYVIPYQRGCKQQKINFKQIINA